MTGDHPGRPLTPLPVLDSILATHALRVREALQDNFIGLYLLGSLAIGDFDRSSDVDFMIVTQHDLTEQERGAVQVCHDETRREDSRWVKRLEYSFFPVHALQRSSSPYGPTGVPNNSADRQRWYVGNGSPRMLLSDHDNTLVTRWTLAHRSPTVLGPEPATFAPPVSAAELRQEIRSSMLGWEALVATDRSLHNRFHQVFLVLNNARALQDLHEGVITSKREGPRWAKDHLGVRWQPLIEYCSQERQDPHIHISQPADPDAWRQTLAFIEHTSRIAESFPL